MGVSLGILKTTPTGLPGAYRAKLCFRRSSCCRASISAWAEGRKLKPGIEKRAVEAGCSALLLSICLKSLIGIQTAYIPDFLTWGLTQSCGHPQKRRPEMGAHCDVGDILG